jgi:hypothetical protein
LRIEQKDSLGGDNTSSLDDTPYKSKSRVDSKMNKQLDDLKKKRNEYLGSAIEVSNFPPSMMKRPSRPSSQLSMRSNSAVRS